MSRWFETDWGKIFTPELSLPEVLVRGTLGYLGIVVLLRLVPRREPGKIALSDLLVVTIVGGVARNPLIGSSSSVVDGFLVITTILLWSVALDWLSYHSSVIHRLLHSGSVVVVRKGRVQEQSLSGELMTREQLRAQLREHGIQRISDVEEARVESDGKVSVIPREKPATKKRRRGRG